MSGEVTKGGEVEGQVRSQTVKWEERKNGPHCR